MRRCSRRWLAQRGSRILISLNFAGGAMSAGEIARLFGHAWPTIRGTCRC